MRSPADAPPRTDLPWLRRRARPAAAPVSPALAEFLSGRGTHPRPGRPTPTVGSSLNLSTSPPPAPAPVVSSSLDLSTTSPAPARAAAPAAPARAAYTPVRVRAGAEHVLTAKAPTVRLTRVQSGVGGLTIEAACSPAVGDLRLGCAYQLRSGPTSVVQHATGVTTAPPSSRRPVILGGRGQFERLTVDLRQVRDLQRLVVYAFSESGAVLQWGGTLVATTFGQARVELPMDRAPSSGVVVLLSVFCIDGELVLRAENEEIAGTVRDAALAYGYERITWLDARTPLV